MSESSANKSLQGVVAEFKNDPAGLMAALEKAFDYRGDVTLTLADGTTVEGYIFDRSKADSLDKAQLRIMRSDDGEKVTVRYAEICAVAFSGRDAAHGKSWENWVKRYVEKKLAGEKAGIEAEKLD